MQRNAACARCMTIDLAFEGRVTMVARF